MLENQYISDIQVVDNKIVYYNHKSVSSYDLIDKSITKFTICDDQYSIYSMVHLPDKIVVSVGTKSYKHVVQIYDPKTSTLLSEFNDNSGKNAWFACSPDKKQYHFVLNMLPILIKLFY